MKQTYTCIICPRSCTLTLEKKEGQFLVSGNKCKRGAEYARQEYENPQRMLTTTVCLEGGTIRSLPVISSGPVPKAKLMPCLEYLYGIQVKAPVSLHDVIVENILDTGVSILAARDAKQTDFAPSRDKERTESDI